MWVLISFFVVHWYLAAFSQSFFLHRYGSHGQFTMSRRWERVFYLLTFLSQGSSYLVPRAYAFLHREHHAHSDTEDDPHSPHFFADVFRMMWNTKCVYEDFLYKRREVPPHLAERVPEWDAVDRIGNSWAMRLGFCALYIGIYVVFAPSLWWFLLLPIHFLMGPVHGAFVNWCGHKYGYRNYDLADHSHNTFRWDALFMGECFQNNHHKYPKRANFATRRSEFDLTWPVIQVLARTGVITLTPRAVAKAA
jgi:stearoyl-CoA desaturase (delta-9 desaturase)